MQASRSQAGVPRVWFLCAVAALFAVFATELYLSARLESQTFDEPAHMYAGYSYWLRSDFGINPEHPPLVKLLATLPFLFERPKYPDPVEIFFRGQSALGGMTMMSAPGADGALASVRTAVSIFAFVLGLLVVLSAREIFGDGAALLALLLFVFDPLILAHAPLLGTDMGATCCIFGAIYAFYRYVERPTLARLGICCAATGLAFASKHSAILVFPIMAMLCVFELLFVRGAGVNGNGMDGEGVESKPAIPSGRRVLRMAAAYCTIVIVAFAILWAFYGFRYAARPNGKEIVPAPAAYLKDLHHPIEANTIGFAERHHLLPESYLFGLTDVTMLARDGRPMYLFGKVYPEGKWFYFPAAFVIKMTIGFLILLVMVPFARALWQKELRREVVFLLLPPVIFFGSAMSAKVDIGIRHILPIMPFLIVLVAGAAISLARQSRKLAWAVAILVVVDVASSLCASPNYLPYSNEAFGGPFHTYRVLADSNVGWGGGLKALHASLARRGITQCWLAYSALPDPKNFQIPCKPLPTFFSSFVDQNPQSVPEHIDGPVFVSEEELMGSFWGPGALNPFNQFSELKPSRAIEGEILEFDGSFDVPMITAESEWVIAEDLLQAGKPDQALPHAQKATALSPNSLIAHEVLMSTYAAQHENDAAEGEYRIALNLYKAIDPGFQDLVGEPADPAAKR